MCELKSGKSVLHFKLWETDVPVGYQEGLEIPMLHYYPAPCKRGSGTVVLCAGGGYHHRAPHEGVGYAEYLNSLGLDAFVVDYRVSPYAFPYALLDARRAVRFVRENALRFGIDPQKIAIMGSSAGGHLAAITSTYKAPLSGEGVDDLDTVDFMPNAQILCYPVLDIEGNRYTFEMLLKEKLSEHEKLTPRLLADENTPPVFLWHTSTDKVVDVNCSLRYCHKLHELGVPVEMHIYPVGGHGLGLANDAAHSCAYVQGWVKNFEAWLSQLGYLNSDI